MISPGTGSAEQGGALVGGLARDAFEVRDGERRSHGSSPRRVPVSLCVLLDVSDSMYGHD